MSELLLNNDEFLSNKRIAKSLKGDRGISNAIDGTDNNFINENYDKNSSDY